MVALWRSEKVKVTSEDLKLYILASPGFSLALLILLLDDIFGTPRGGKEAKRLIDLLPHNLKNLRQCERELEFGQGASDSVVLFSETLVSDSKLLMQTSKTPLGVWASSFSFSMSKHLKSTEKKPNIMTEELEHGNR